MNMMIVYDSVFGNTEKVARAISSAIERGMGPLDHMDTLSVSQVTVEKLVGLDLLIVGSPTRGFRPTEGITKLLTALPKNHLENVKVAAFDTRIVLETINSTVFRFIVNKGGYAASSIAKSLQKRGGILVAPPEGFLVTGEQGPLKEGELERAAQWAAQLLQPR